MMEGGESLAGGLALWENGRDRIVVGREQDGCERNAGFGQDSQAGQVIPVG